MNSAFNNPPGFPMLRDIKPDLYRSTTVGAVIRHTISAARYIGFVWSGEAGKGILSLVMDTVPADAIQLVKADGTKFIPGCDLHQVAELEAVVRARIEEVHDLGLLTVSDAIDVATALFDTDIADVLGYGTLTTAFRKVAKVGEWRRVLAAARRQNERDQREAATKILPHGPEPDDGRAKFKEPKPPKGKKAVFYETIADDDDDDDNDDDAGAGPSRGGGRLRARTALRDGVSGERGRQREQRPSPPREKVASPPRRSRVFTPEPTPSPPPARRSIPRRSVIAATLKPTPPTPERRSTRSKGTPPSYDAGRGGSKTSMYACYAFMFNKDGCTKPNCQYSHKRRVIREYREQKAEDEAAEKEKARDKDNGRSGKRDRKEDDTDSEEEYARKARRGRK